MDIRHADCRFPERVRQSGECDKEDLAYSCEYNRSFLFFGDDDLCLVHEFKYRYVAVGFSKVVKYLYVTKSQEYETLVELESELRKIQIPQAFGCPISEDGKPEDGKAWSSDPTVAMMQYTLVIVKEMGEYLW